MKKIYLLLFLISLFLSSSLYSQDWYVIKQGVDEGYEAVFFTSENTGYSVGVGLSKTTDGGVSWFEQFVDTTNQYHDIFFTSPNTGYIAGSSLYPSWDDKIFKTTNAGNNWIVKFSYNMTYGFYKIHFPSDNIGYVSGGSGILFKTTNAGNNWISQVTNTTGFLSSIFFINNDTGWFTTQYSIFYTTNGGNNWTVQFTSSIDLNSIHFVDLNNGYAGGGGYILKSTNGGINWSIINTGYPFACYKIFFININTGFQSGEGIIMKTTNAGYNWSLYLCPYNYYLRGLHFYKNVGYSCGSKNDDYVMLKTILLLDSPSLLSPSNNSAGVSLSPTLVWDSVSFATGYKIFISTDTLFSTIIDSATVSTTQYNIPTGKLNLATKYYWKVAGYNSYSSGNWSNTWNFVTLNNLTLNLKVYLEGFWNGTIQVTDTVKVYLANSTSPYEFVDSAEVLLSANGTGTFNFTKCPNSNYYIVVTHRNHLETWSRYPRPFAVNVPVSYNFTTAYTQAYGFNLVFSNGAWCIFGGDINGDGFVDGADMALLDNDLFNYASGYIVTDVNGDQFVDGADMAILDNNLYNYIGVIRPGGKDANQRSTIFEPERKQSKTIREINEN